MVYIYAFLGRLLLYPYLSFRLARLLSSGWSKVCNILIGVEFAFSTLSLLVHRFIMCDVMSIIMDINLYIFFGLGYVTLFLMLLNALHWLLGRYVRPFSSLFSLRVRYGIDWFVACLSSTLFVVLLYMGYQSGHHIRVVDYSPKAEGREVLAKLALVTDLHIGEGVGDKHVRQVVDTLLSLQPDAILFGGDFIDHDAKYAYQEGIINEMRRLKARDGIYFVPGNHEYRLDSVANFTWVDKVGGTLLIDSIVYPRNGAYSIIGRDDYWHNDTRKPLGTLLDELQPKAYNILLEHTPEGLDSLRGTPLDYALYGHTHGGQLFPYKYLLRLKYDLPYGTQQYGRTQAIVSSGVGAAGTLFRIGTTSEIVTITLYKD